MASFVSVKPTFAAFLLVALVGEAGTAAAAPAPGEDQPIVARASAGRCRIVVRGGGTVFAAWMTGLVPGETFLFTSTSENEVIGHESTADASGNAFSILLPAVRGKKMGTATAGLKASRCQMSVAYGWQM